MKERTVNPDIGSLLKIYFRNEGEMKIFSEERKLREFIVGEPALKGLLK